MYLEQDISIFIHIGSIGGNLIYSVHVFCCVALGLYTKNE